MNVFDKTKFSKVVPLVAMKVSSKSVGSYLSAFQEFLFDRPKIKRVHEEHGDSQAKLILLSESVVFPVGEKSEAESKEEIIKQLPEELQPLLREVSFKLFELQIGYDYFTAEEVLRQLLPENTEIPSSFEQAGHIAHLNLREEMLPFKSIIGQVLIDKNPHIKTVVNKIGNIETEFRTFPMEVIAGEENFNVSLKESGAKFSFNFATVYWNSRLQTEHARLIQKILFQKSSNPMDSNKKRKADEISHTKPTLVIADMMAGVGPFAVPLAMSNSKDSSAEQQVIVYANDLNPESYRYLEINRKQNHCEKYLHCFNQDGRQFILDLLEKNIEFDEVIMNLPQSATSFLDVFIGLQTRLGPDKYAMWSNRLPRIHVYAFSTDIDNSLMDVAMRSASILRCDVKLLNYRHDERIKNKCKQSKIDSHHHHPRSSKEGEEEEDIEEKDVCKGYIVRDVSPKKVMVCLSFRLPREVAQRDLPVLES